MEGVLEKQGRRGRWYVLRIASYLYVRAVVCLWLLWLLRVECDATNDVLPLRTLDPTDSIGPESEDLRLSNVCYLGMFQNLIYEDQEWF